MAARSRSRVCIVTPGTRDANNGNWRTAARWAAMLRGSYRVILQSEWRGEPTDLLIALHAKRSAASIAAFREYRGDAPIALVLTGTDLYRDLAAKSKDAIASLDAADRVVALQEDAPRLLKAAWRDKCEVIYQSAPALTPAKKAASPLRAVAVGHLREEKDPRTIFAAMRELPPEVALEFTHIGSALDAALGVEARALQKADPRYHYAGALTHGLARAAIKRAHVLVHPSIMEGGANVIVEAITAGTPVIASRMSGNVGMLGADYPGYFEVGDAAGLRDRLARLAEDRRSLVALERAARARRALFHPAAEARAVRRLVAGLLA